LLYNEIDKFLNIENIAGSIFDDILTGDDNNNVIMGNRGHDTIDCRGGVDTVSYRELYTSIRALMNETSVSVNGISEVDRIANCENINGTDYNDTIVGDDNNNILWGWGGNDQFLTRGGNDTVYGGDGIDVISYINS